MRRPEGWRSSAAVMPPLAGRSVGSAARRRPARPWRLGLHSGIIRPAGPKDSSGRADAEQPEDVGAPAGGVGTAGVEDGEPKRSSWARARADIVMDLVCLEDAKPLQSFGARAEQGVPDHRLFGRIDDERAPRWRLNSAGFVQPARADPALAAGAALSRASDFIVQPRGRRGRPTRRSSVSLDPRPRPRGQPHRPAPIRPRGLGPP